MVVKQLLIKFSEKLNNLNIALEIARLIPLKYSSITDKKKDFQFIGTKFTNLTI